MSFDQKFMKVMWIVSNEQIPPKILNYMYIKVKYMWDDIIQNEYYSNFVKPGFIYIYISPIYQILD